MQLFVIVYVRVHFCAELETKCAKTLRPEDIEMSNFNTITELQKCSSFLQKIKMPSFV